MAAAIAGGVWWSLPPSVICFTDDFGYLRSVVLTRQLAYPQTDDWLEPWAASLSSISAGLWYLTGSFRFATYGLQSILAGSIFAMLALLLRSRGVGALSALAFACFGITLPTMLWKIAEFGAVPLYVVALLVAIAALPQRRWWCFGLAYLVAVSSRQSALVWLVLPLGVAVKAWLTSRRGEQRTALVVVAIGTAAYIVLDRTMNVTHARAVMTPSMWSALDWAGFLRRSAVGVATCVVAMGIGGFIVRVGLQGGPTDRGRPLQFVMRLCAAAVVVAFWCVDPRVCVEIEHGLYAGTGGTVLVGLLCSVSVAGWLWSGFRLSFEHLLASAAAIALVGLRPVVWEYYLIDIVVLSLFAVTPAIQTTSPAPTVPFARIMGGTVASAIVLVQLACSSNIKSLLDHHHAVISLVEPALRSGRLSPSDLSVAPFGYQGWHLYPHFVRYGPRADYIANFLGYVAADAVFLRAELATGSSPVDGKLIATGTFPWRWTQTGSLSLIRGEAKAAALTLDLERYQFQPWPMGDAEWAKLIARQR